MSTDHEQPTTSPAPPDPGVVQGGRSNLRRNLIGALIVIALAVVAVLAIGALGRHETAASDPAAAARIAEAMSVTVTYEVETSDPAGAIADITYSTPSGIGQQAGVDVPLMRAKGGGRGIQVTVPAGTFVQISAQLSADNGDSGPTDITCRIRSGDAVVAENTSTGQFSIASCEGHA